MPAATITDSKNSNNNDNGSTKSSDATARK